MNLKSCVRVFVGPVFVEQFEQSAEMREKLTRAWEYEIAPLHRMSIGCEHLYFIVDVLADSIFDARMARESIERSLERSKLFANTPESETLWTRDWDEAQGDIAKYLAESIEETDFDCLSGCDCSRCQNKNEEAEQRSIHEYYGSSVPQTMRERREMNARRWPGFGEDWR